MTSRENDSPWGRKSYLLSACALFLGSLTINAGGTLPSAGSPAMAASQGRAARPDKLPEDWTLEERLTWRFDPEDARRRREDNARESGREPDLTDDHISVEGRKDPELLLPTELFDSLLTFALLPDPAREDFQKSMKPALQSLGFDATFWTSLETAIPEYYAQQREIRRIGRLSNQSSGDERTRLRLEMEGLQRTQCQDRTAALAKAREFFGARRFDRVLYRVVAPLTNIAESNERSLPEQLRQIERGDC